MAKKQGWHRADIIAALHKRGSSLAAESRALGLSASTLQNALVKPWPKGELIPGYRTLGNLAVSILRSGDRRVYRQNEADKELPYVEDTKKGRMTPAFIAATVKETSAVTRERLQGLSER